MVKRCSLLIIVLLMTFSARSQEPNYNPPSWNPVYDATEADREALVKYAKLYMNIPYLSAGANPERGFDCSGFVYYVFSKFNIRVPRSSIGYKYLGIALKPDEFQIGDILVFYGYKDRNTIGHVGIICEANGMKSRFIHSSSGPAYGVTISDLDSKLYRLRFYKCISFFD